MLLWLIACTPEAGLGKLEEQAMPAPYESPDREPLPDPLTIQEIEDAIPMAMETIFAAKPHMLFYAQADMQNEEDDACPIYDDYYQEYYGRYFWEGDCTSATGSRINGWSDYLRLIDTVYNGVQLDDYGIFTGDATYHRPDGQSYYMAGGALLNDLDYGSYHYWRAYLTGSYIWDGADWGDTWLAQGLDYYVNIDAYHYDYGARRLWMDGGVGGLPGLINTVDMVDVLWYDEFYGATCWQEPGGKIALRDGAGRWYEVVFHGHTEDGAGVFPPLCDGCGDVYIDGNPYGTVCPDFTALFSWGAEGPWTE